MAKKSKLLAALDAHQGRDYEAEKRQKQVKAAEKRKKQKGAREAEADLSEDAEDQDQMDGVETTAAEDFTAFSDNEDTTTKDQSKPSTTNGSSNILQPSEDGVADESVSEAEQESDVPLSDLSDSELEDTIPHQRLTINNGPALIASRNRISVVKSSTIPFHVHNSLISTLPSANFSIPDPNDDLTRELEFYRIARDAAVTARTLLKKEKIPFTRPPDYFAEMVKTDEHMGRVKKKMYDSAAGKKASEEARRQRDAKKFGKAVQVAKEQERAKGKRETLDKIKDLKRKRKGQDTGLVRESDAGGADDSLFQRIDVESAPKKDKLGRERGPGGNDRGRNINNKRQKKDEKFGFGGRKRFAKSGDAESSSDMRGFSASGMKGRGGGRGGRGGGRGGSSRGGRGGGGGSRGGAQRPGKSRRMSSK